MTNHARHTDRQTEALEQAQRHWQARQAETAAAADPPATGSAWTIALEREAGTPGTSVAREVGERLGWPVYDHELVEKIARESGLRVSLLESVDERRQSWLQETIETFAAVPYVSETGYARHLLETILSLGAHGGCVIVGRGAAQILPAQTTLRVRLMGQLEDRIAFASRRLNLSPQEAARWVEETNRQRVRFVKDHFLKDPTDPLQYDLILSISRWTVPECADLIVQALQRLSVRSANAGLRPAVS